MAPQDQIFKKADKVQQPRLASYLQCGPRKAINDQASPIRHIWVKDDIQERITNLHESTGHDRMGQSASHVVMCSQLRHICSPQYISLLHAGKGRTQQSVTENPLQSGSSYEESYTERTGHTP